MGAREIAEHFVRSFCNGDLQGIASVLSDTFRLRGPLFEFSSPAEYLASLSGNLERDPNAEILASFGNGDEAAVFYSYQGNTVGQLFHCRAGQICETTLVFDTKKVA